MKTIRRRKAIRRVNVNDAITLNSVSLNSVVPIGIISRDMTASVISVGDYGAVIFLGRHVTNVMTCDDICPIAANQKRATMVGS
jgi:hypothetical protein